MKRFVLLSYLAVVKSLYAGDPFVQVSQVSDLRLMTTAVNRYIESYDSSVGHSLRLGAIRKQKSFEQEKQIQLAARCKFIRAMLMAHGKEVPSEQDIVDAAKLFLQAAEEGDTDAVEAVLFASKKSSMHEVLAEERRVILEQIKAHVSLPVLMKENFLQQRLTMNVVDIFASIAARDDEANIRAVIPEDSSDVDDAVLAQTRFRFRLLLGNALPLASDTEKDLMLSYINRLENSFQKEQEEFFGISAYENLEPISSNQNVLDSRLFHITGGFDEILSTTPDKALGPKLLGDFILDDFRMVVSFVNAMGLISSETGNRKLRETRQRLISFSEKWNDNSVLSYMSDVNGGVAEAQEFIGSIRDVIEEVK